MHSQIHGTIWSTFVSTFHSQCETFGIHFIFIRWKSSYQSPQQIIDFAKFKLLCGSEVTDPGALAAVSTRLLFDFEQRREDAQVIESALVASHMRIVYSIPKHRYYMRTGTPSEPIAAEAAAQIMMKLGDGSLSDSQSRVLDRIRQWLANGILDKSELGELVARLLITFAHDSAVEGVTRREREDVGKFSCPVPVVDFIQALFQPNYAEMILDSSPQNVVDGKPLREAFKDACIHFTHFGRTEVAELLTEEAAFAAICRGMGWVFSRFQDGVDMGIPVFLKDRNEKLRASDMSMIFFQIKNSNRANRATIDLDDPRFQFFTKTQTGEADKRPYIVITMNLGVVPKLPPKDTEVPKSDYLMDSNQNQGATRSSASIPKRARAHDISTITEARTELTKRLKTSKQDYDPTQSPSEIGQPFAKTRLSLVRPPKSDQDLKLHPRYQINANGCSSSVYRVIKDDQKDQYYKILCTRDMMHEHPRPETGYIEAVYQMKPLWNRGLQSFSWLKMERPLNTLMTDLMAVEDGVTIGTQDDEEVREAVGSPED
jgi:hypothetical protein